MPYSFQSPQKSQIRYSNHIKGYQIQEQIGKGGFGVVYRAISQTPGSLGKELAIKMVKSYNEINKQEMRRLKLTKRVANEVEIHWQLRNSAILELFNYFEDTEYVYMIMELCENGNLYQYLKERKFLSEAETRGLLLQLIHGLQYLHSNGIIHRDLKLSNLLLNSKNELKIADFGLAVKLQDPSGEQKTMCGTPNYISPEIVSRMPYGLASDVWALGCMMVTLLTGKPPFESSAIKNTLDRVAKADYTLPASLSPEAQDLIHRMLQKEPQKRIRLVDIPRHPFFDQSKPIQKLDAPQMVFASPLDHPNTEPVLKHDLPKIDTRRLKQIAQNTKHGKIEIQHDLQLVVDFISDPEILMISSDGFHISVIQRNGSKSPDSVTQRFTVVNLPERYHKKCRYASRFVDLVRSKTPKVIYYSPLAKVSLMENEPADIVASFYSGVKFTFIRSKNQIDIRIPKENVSLFASSKLKQSADGNYTFTSSTKGIEPVFKELFEHVNRCLEYCLEIEKKSSTGKYPIILKSHQSPSKIHMPRSQSPPTSIHPSVNTFSTSYHDNRSIPSRPTSRISDRPPLNNVNKIPTDLHRSKSSVQNSDFVSTSSISQAEFKPKFLENVGWCLPMPDKRFSVLFNDGIQVIMNPKSHSLEYIGETRTEYF